MRNAISLLIVCHGLSLAPSAAFALGFGRVDSATVLGQRLNFSAQLSVEPQDALTEACVSAEVSVGDSRVPAEQVRISLAGPGSATQKTLRITTSVAIDEPVVGVNVTIGCVARISRSFVVFADPPAIERAPAEVAGVSLPVTTAALEPRAPAAPAAPSNLGAENLGRDPIRRAADAPTPTSRPAAQPRRRPPTSAPVTARDAARARSSSTPAPAAPAAVATTSAAPSRPVAPRAAAASASAVARGGPRLQLEAARPAAASP